MIPTPAALSILHSLKHGPLEEAYARAYSSVKMEEHRREVRAGTIGLLMRLFVHAAIMKGDNTVYLFSGYALD